MQKPNDKQWSYFVATFLDTESETSNVKGDFTKLSKSCGPAYFEFLKAQWICSRDFMTAEEFCKVNGNVPIQFFDMKIRDKDSEFEVIEISV